MEKIRAASTERMTPVAVLADLPGPKMRTGMFPEGRDPAEHDGDVVAASGLATMAAPGEVNINVDDLLEAVQPGHRIVLADGQVLVEATAVEDGVRRGTVLRAGPVGNRKGVHLPDSDVRYDLPTDEDRELIQLARELGVDMLGISFVGNASELEEIRGLAPGIQLVSKIERKAALKNLDEILEATDGVMVASGDLGVELDLEQLPLVQKEILRRAVLRRRLHDHGDGDARVDDRGGASDPGRGHGRGQRGARRHRRRDAVGGDGRRQAPDREAVATMARIARVAEQSGIYARRPRLAAAPEKSYFSRATAMAAVHVANQVDVDRIVCFSETGNTVRLLSRFRPDAEIVALSPSPDTVRQMAVLAHVRPILFRQEPTLEAMIDTAADLLLARQIVKLGDRVVFVGACL